MVKETVLVTGGCGFVGTRLVAALKGAGHSVRVLDIPRADFTTVEALGAKTFRGSVADGESVHVALGTSRAVFHLVAPDMSFTDDAFIRRMVVAGAEVVMEELEDTDVRHVVAASTTGVFAQADGVRGEGAHVRPKNRLEVAKLDMERALRRGAARTGVDVSCLRPSNIYGWGDRGIVDALVPQVRSGEELVLPDKGWVNTVHVADVVSAARQLATASRIAESKGVGPEGRFMPFTCTDDRPHRVDGLVEAVAGVLGVRPPPVRGPGLVGPKGPWVERDRSVRFAERNRYSNGRLKELLEDWPAWPSLEEGLAVELEPVRL